VTTELDRLVEGFDTPLALDLRFAGVPVRVLTNAGEIRDSLRGYFAPWVDVRGSAGRGDATAITVRLVQAEAPTTGGFVPVARGDGKAPKEAVRDVRGGRLVLKVATGVLMGLRSRDAFAVGDLVHHLNQGINLINNRYAKAVLERGHLLLHASAVARDGRAVALAGPPGAGKSTSALHLVEAGFRFVSNDRLLVRARADAVEAMGYPKQPRVNPGTLLHHVRLSRLLEPDDRAALAALPPADLWKLERKRDVDLETIYGEGTVTLDATLHGLIVLTWRPAGAGLTVRALDRPEALACLPLIRKDLGAFDPEGRRRGAAVREVLAYSALFGRIPVVEVSGRVEFSALGPIVDDLLGSGTAAGR
jgi:HprK-related kinase B